MPTETRIIPLPLKGVNRNWPRGVQPELTCWDSMNVLPFDRQGRTRLALRAGAGKVDRLDEALPVRCLHIASIVATPSSGGNSFTWSEPFTYTNGDLTGQGGWLADVGLLDSTVVASNNVTNPSFGSTSSWANQNIADLAGFDPAAAWTCDIVVRGTSGLINDSGIQIDLEMDPTFVTTGVRVTMDMELNNIDASTSLPDSNSANVPTLNDGNAHTITLSMSVARVLSVSFDGGAALYTINADAAVGANIGTSILLNVDTGGATAGGELVTESITLTNTGGGPVALNRTALRIVGTSGTRTYVGTQPSTMTQVADAGDAYLLDADAPYISMATLFGLTYIVDGTSIIQLNTATPAFETYTVSAGSAPTGCTIAVPYRGRLVLSGSTADPQNFFASKAGDPTDWDYGATGPDRAFAGNASTSGRIIGPVQALMPLSDDIMLIAGESYVCAMRGDIADGGSIDLISSSAGCVGQQAWCIAADGSVYFVGHNGLYRADPNGTAPVEVSRDVYKQFFQGVDSSTNRVSMIYDPTRYGIWIFVSPEDVDDAPGTHLFYYIPTESFWPIEFTYKPDIGPLSTVYWNNYGPGDQYPVLGGYLGDISLISFTNRRDNGDSDNVLISGYIVLGPFQAQADMEGLLSQISVVGGEVLAGNDPSVWHMTWTLKGGPSAYSVTEGDAQYTAVAQVTLDKWRGAHNTRIRGQWFTIRLGNEFNDGDYFSIEQVSVKLMPSGNIRRPG